MAGKTNIRSIRMSDELVALVEMQIGDTFSDKLKTLITKCVWELPAKREELIKIDQEITAKKQEVKALAKEYAIARCRLKSINASIQEIEKYLNM